VAGLAAGGLLVVATAGTAAADVKDGPGGDPLPLPNENASVRASTNLGTTAEAPTPVTSGPNNFKITVCLGGSVGEATEVAIGTAYSMDSAGTISSVSSVEKQVPAGTYTFPASEFEEQLTGCSIRQPSDWASTVNATLEVDADAPSGPHDLEVVLVELGPGTGIQLVSVPGYVEVTQAATDTTAPDTTIKTSPLNPSNSSSASFSFTGSDDVTPPASLTFECSLDSAPFTACTSPQTYTGLTDGSHTFQVRAKDAADNVDPTPPSYMWLVDTTAPSITYLLSPVTPDGNDGWYRSDVSLGWTVTTDGGSGLASTSGCGDTTVTTDQQATDYTCSATDHAGNAAGPVTVSIQRDATPPVIVDEGVFAGTLGFNGWYVSKVINEFSATDETSGLSAEVSSPFSKDSGMSEGSAVTIASGTVADKAGNVAASIDSAPFKIDLSDPTNIQFVGGPAGGDSYAFGQVQAVPTCTADDAISGLDNCEVTGYSTAVGTHTMTATATDNAGRTAKTQRTYTVNGWTLDGFYKPVTMGDVVNTVKAGSTVPLKFKVLAGTTEFSSVEGIGAEFNVVPVSCDSGAPEDAVDFTTTGSTSLRYDESSGQFIQNWKTPKRPAGCYLVTMTTGDGSLVEAKFQLK
jgi:hypothetical protein